MNYVFILLFIPMPKLCLFELDRLQRLADIGFF